MSPWNLNMSPKGRGNASEPNHQFVGSILIFRGVHTNWNFSSKYPAPWDHVRLLHPSTQQTVAGRQRRTCRLQDMVSSSAVEPNKETIGKHWNHLKERNTNYMILILIDFGSSRVSKNMCFFITYWSFVYFSVLWRWFTKRFIYVGIVWKGTWKWKNACCNKNLHVQRRDIQQKHMD